MCQKGTGGKGRRCAVPQVPWSPREERADEKDLQQPKGDFAEVRLVVGLHGILQPAGVLGHWQKGKRMLGECPMSETKQMQRG